jgi:hypothetical protein
MIWRLAIAAMFLHLVLIQPNHPAAMTWGAFRLVPLELPVLLLGLPLIGDTRFGRMLRGGLAAVLTLTIVLKLADFGMFTAFGRGFNPVGDLPLALAGFNLLSGSIGTVLAVLAFVGAGMGLVALTLALWWAMTIWSQAPVQAAPAWLRRTAGGVAVVLAAAGTLEAAAIMNRWALPLDIPGSAFTTRVAAERVRLVLRTFDDLQEFRKRAENDPFKNKDGLLDLIDRDVIVVFIESYGRASVEGPLYAATTRAVLTNAERDLGAQGFAMRSGYVSSSTRGGQSWLAHATFAKGLRVHDQVRYQALLASGRDGLFHIAQRSGFRTAAVMPAITMAWPEAARMGFDRILAASDLGYQGKPFNWVTMPDQFTLLAFDRLVRQQVDREQKLFAQVVLISSHAPWVPVPRMIDWNTVGDGRVFDAMATEGDPPDVVWRDRDRVRDQYRQAVAYSLEAVFGYAARLTAEKPLIVVLGDHQPAGFVAQEDRSDVPVHIIGPASLVERTAEWGFAPGLVPPETLAPLPMENLRDLFVRSYSSGPLP